MSFRHFNKDNQDDIDFKYLWIFKIFKCQIKIKFFIFCHQYQKTEQSANIMTVSQRNRLFGLHVDPMILGIRSSKFKLKNDQREGVTQILNRRRLFSNWNFTNLGPGKIIPQN